MSKAVSRSRIVFQFILVLFLLIAINNNNVSAAPSPLFSVDDSYTVSLLHMNGTDGSLAFTDESSKIWSPAGNVQIDTAQSKFDGASGFFDGNGDYIETADSEDFNIGAGDFTVDFWFRKNANGIDQAAFGQTDSVLTRTDTLVYGYMGIANNTLEFGVYNGDDALLH
jgi:hypothetical protein